MFMGGCIAWGGVLTAASEAAFPLWHRLQQAAELQRAGQDAGRAVRQPPGGGHGQRAPPGVPV